MIRLCCLALLMASLFLPRSSARADAARPCSTAPYLALTFTIGTWTITDSAGNSRGTATIAYTLDGCAVQETWSAPDGHRGINIDAYSADDRHWHRLFVDNKGHVHTFTGNTNGASILYTGVSRGTNGTLVLNRLLIDTLRPGAAMRQTWQQSDDDGRNWRRVFQDHYRLVKG
jgi:hypothetical protein